MTPRLPAALLCLLLAASFPFHSRAGEAAAPAQATPESGTVEVKVQAQAWQTRRSGFADIVNNLASKDPKTLEAFKAVLTEFEQQPFTRTPMENMEILGVYYVPVEGIEPTLYLMAANAALGWYDALRFGTESGRSEILHNEGFFKLPLVLAGEEHIAATIKFFEEQPEKTAQQVQRGIELAEILKDDPRYDHHWPSAYGLERTLCAMGQECEQPRAIPRESWNDAWAEAKARVVHYYRDNSPKPSTLPPAKPAAKPAAKKR